MSWPLASRSRSPSQGYRRPETRGRRGIISGSEESSAQHGAHGIISGQSVLRSVFSSLSR
jgi:hypothetical protein